MEDAQDLLYRELLNQLQALEEFAGRNASGFSQLYYLFRPMTLVLATTTTVVSSLYNTKSPSITVLAGLVTLVTALDSWLKPQAKWKLHDEMNDRANDLRMELASIGNGDLAALNILRVKVGTVVDAYRIARLLE